MELVLCDDLTGCFDVAENSFDLYKKITILTYPPLFSTKISDSDLLIISSETRNCNDDDIKIRIEKIVKFIEENGLRLIFKKIDSTLRGNILLENILLRKFYKKIVLIPANPVYLRRVKNGHLYVEDKIITDTIYGNDIHSPVRDSEVLKYIPDKSGIAPDLIEESDFKRIINSLKENYFPVGSSTFFRYFIMEKLNKKPFKKRYSFNLNKKVLFINGSLNNVSQKDEVNLKKITNKKIISIDKIKYLDSIPSVINTRSVKKFEGLNQYKEFLIKILIKNRYDTLIISGGETLMQFCNIMGIKNMEISDSFSNGLPVFSVKIDNKSINIIPKPGGYPLFSQ